MSVNIVIRNVSADMSESIKAHAARHGLSQQELLTSILEREFGTPPTVWGYIKLDRPGDIDIGEDCPVCGVPANNWWLQVCNTGEMHLMCDICATSE